jgi:hypothetical protein
MRQGQVLAVLSILVFGLTGAAQAVVINFDALMEDEVVTNQFPEATFSSEAGFEVIVTNGRNFGNSQPFFVCTAPEENPNQTCTEDVFLNFTDPVNNLTFLALGDNNQGTVGVVDVFDMGGLAGTVNIIGNANANDPIFVDITGFADVTRIVIRDISDAAGLGYDDFTFEVQQASEPTALFLIGVGLVGIAARLRRRS